MSIYRSHARLAFLFLIGAALQGCIGSLPVVAGPDNSGAPSFSILRDDRLITAIAVACEENDGSWKTLWQVAGVSDVTAIEYGVAPRGMDTIVPASPIDSQRSLCSIEVHAKGKKGGTYSNRSLWILEPNVMSCRSERRCMDILRQEITDARPRGFSAHQWSAA